MQQPPISPVEIKPLPDGRVNTEQAARYLGLRPRTLESLRCRGHGPRYMKIGRVFYFLADLDVWIQSRACETSDSPGSAHVEKGFDR